MKTVTFEEIKKNVEQKEAMTAESPETTKMIEGIAETMLKEFSPFRHGKARIDGDYDCDGETSTYIIAATLQCINPDIEIEIRPNDRRGGYGVSASAEKETKGVMHIVTDMGSNQLDLLDEKFGVDNYLLIDHHIVEDEANRQRIIANPQFCNPHTLNTDDGQNAQYCAAGLAFRIYEAAKKLAQEKGMAFNTSEKKENTLTALAALGTAADVVDLNDVNSLNRSIVKRGVEVINNATHDNFDYLIGAMFSAVKISEETTAHQLAYNAGALFNCPSRMSSYYGVNGAKMLGELLMINGIENGICHKNLGESTQADLTYAMAKQVKTFTEWNDTRKRIIADVTKSPEYKAFSDSQRFGDDAKRNIAVFVIPKNITIPPECVGLIAGRLEEMTDKAIIVLSQKENGTYSGSGRSPESIETSLHDYVKKVLEAEELSDKVVCGGHKQAIGISRIDPENLDAFVSAINKYAGNVKMSDTEKVYLAPSEFFRPDALEMVQSLEPIGQGCSLPVFLVEGAEQYREKLFKNETLADGTKQPRADWKTVKVKNADGEVLQATDWNYDPNIYIQEGKNKIEFTAVPSISTFRGETRLELTAQYDRKEFIERGERVLGASIGKDVPVVPFPSSDDGRDDVSGKDEADEPNKADDNDIPLS